MHIFKILIVCLHKKNILHLKMGGAVRCHILNERQGNVGLTQRSQSDQKPLAYSQVQVAVNKLILDPLTQRLEHIMSSGRDVYLERLQEEHENRLDTPYEVTYYLRVNGDKITHGHMKQVDDNLKIVYNTAKKSFTVFYL